MHVFMVRDRQLPNHIGFPSKALMVSLQGKHRRKIIAVYTASSCSKYKSKKTAPFTLHLLSLNTMSGKRSKSVVLRVNASSYVGGGEECVIMHRGRAAQAWPLEDGL